MGISGGGEVRGAVGVEGLMVVVRVRGLGVFEPP